jgi:hypothetical protein
MPRLYRSLFRHAVAVFSVALFLFGVSGIHVHVDDRCHGNHHHVDLDFGGGDGGDTGNDDGHDLAIHIHGGEQFAQAPAIPQSLTVAEILETRPRPVNQAVLDSLPKEVDVPPVNIPRVI